MTVSEVKHVKEWTEENKGERVGWYSSQQETNGRIRYFVTVEEVTDVNSSLGSTVHWVETLLLQSWVKVVTHSPSSWFTSIILLCLLPLIGGHPGHFILHFLLRCYLLFSLS